MTSNMIDMLVKLYNLPEVLTLQEKLLQEGIVIRTARAYEKPIVLAWVEKHFSSGWAGECDACFANSPVSVNIATKNGEIIGFSCHEATYKGFFGPIGILPEIQGEDLGSALLLTSLHAMKNMGYAYAIIGGPTTAVGFYEKVVGASPIEGSNPGIYVDRLVGSDS